MTVGHAVLREGIRDLPPDVGFLIGRVAPDVLRAAARDAPRLGACAHELLISRGVIGVDEYYRAVADSIGASFSTFVGLRFPTDPFAGHEPSAAARLGMLMVSSGSRLEIAAAPRGRQVAAMMRAIRERPGTARQIRITTPQGFTDAIVACGRFRLLEGALTGLGRLSPRDSARSLLCRWQAASIVAVAAGIVATAFARPDAALFALASIIGLFFLGVISIRLIAVAVTVLPGAREPCVRLSDGDLPVYTVLVPVYREAHLIKGLVEALRRLDYPAHKLDIKIVAEADDPETLSVLRRCSLPPQFEIVTVPDTKPKTKPKALSFALPLARGSLVTIFDAEDLPEPGQLRRAAQRFAAEPSDVACLQASLSWYNWPESWFTRQLAIEYASLFDILLPALDRLDLPFPLGGTSNHFRIEALVEVGAWDAFNVTEDADLGLRLARAGYRCRTLRSRTFEEAPITFGPWLRQRTRWLKGWIQTYCVHMRRPLQLLDRLGPVRFLAVQAVFGGVVAASFAHPVFVAIVASQVARGDIFVEAGNPLISMLIWLGAFNLLAGYLAGIAIAVAALRQRSMWWLIPELALLPVYWLTMSIAAVRALWQLAHAPSIWEKTEHGLTRMDKAHLV